MCDLESTNRRVHIPVTLVKQILHDGLPAPGQPHSLFADTLFSDISGFTAMSEELASDGPRGAEELNRVLFTTFTAMIDVIHESGGAISHFYGDAMSVYFPVEGETTGRDVAQRALACAQMMQLHARQFWPRRHQSPAGQKPGVPFDHKNWRGLRPLPGNDCWRPDRKPGICADRHGRRRGRRR
ncbi:MAG: adenylate/guanylate cyclase domain-containing protein [Chloroflexi bacterium]|nr:adenylate/guanylate cyclase domain-containing protein [Chloroflexota bacterium]